MKSFYALSVAALLAIPTMASAITIDGIAESAYGPPIVTQQVATGFGDSTNGLVGPANGSELDAAYGFISNSVLYLVFAGNMENNFNHLEIFIDSIPGGQNTLTNVNNGVDYGGLNRMGTNGNGATNGTPGLTFDADFAPDFYIGVTEGGVTNIYANYAVLLTNGGGPGYYLGTTLPTNSTLTGGSNPYGIQATINNSNTAGVTGDVSGCYSNGAPFNPGAVTTGVELAIPLSAIGGAVGTVKVCALINGSGHNFLSNQVLGPLGTNDPNYCVGNLGEPSAVNLSTLPGQHYFLVPAVGCNYSISPVNALYPATGGAGSVALTTQGGCAWAATSNVPWVTITSLASGIGNGTVSYSVGTNTTTIGRSGTVTIAGQTFTVNQYSQPLGSVQIDGTAETNQYGCAPLAVQQLGTSFGDSITGDVDVANGSELDAAYGRIENGVLYLTLAGNLSSDYTKLEIFFETGPGGQNTLTNVNPDVDFNGINRMGPNGNGATNGTPGLTFDADFAPNYWIGVTCGGAPFAFYANYAQLWPGGTNASGIAVNGYFLGSTVGDTNGALFAGTNPLGIQATVNNSNTGGVSGDSCFDDPSIYNQGSVRTGVELGIPLAALGYPTGAIKICAFVNGSGHDWVSNQILGPLWDGTGFYCSASLGEPSAVNFSTLPGQHYFVVGQMRVTGITRTGNDINVSWLTGGSNLVYQLQSTSTLTTTSVWSAVGSPTNGIGAAITQTDGYAATNSTMFYRVQESPLCP